MASQDENNIMVGEKESLLSRIFQPDLQTQYHYMQYLL